MSQSNEAPVTGLRRGEGAVPFDPRDALLRQNHPVFRKNYVIPTPAISALAREVVSWLRRGETGGIVTGRSGQGKTRAIRYIQRARRELFGPGTAVLCLPMTDLPSYKGAFYQHVAGLLGFRIMQARPAPIALREKIVAGLRRECERENALRLVLFLDDAQFLSAEDYLAFKPIYDVLVEQYERRVLVVSVGEEGLAELRTDLEAVVEKETQTLVNRFLGKTTQLRAIESGDELASIFEIYDTLATFPPGTETSFCESLYPRAYAAGVRLKPLGPSVIELYRQSQLIGASGGELVMSMQVCTRFLISLLDEMAELDSDTLRITDSMLITAMRDATGHARGCRKPVK